jgi:Protein of unknown function (DUF2726)
MPPEIAALIAKPLLLAAVIAVGVVAGIVVERTNVLLMRSERRARWLDGRHNAGALPFRKTKTAIPLKGTPERATLDATEQLRCVMEADFTERLLLNRPEAAVFKALDAAVIARNPRWQVMAQVSIGEFLASQDQDAYLAVNSKRVDFALMDEACRVRHALEYQGAGHHQGSAAARDAVKKEALRKAGIGYHEVVAGHTTPAELRRLVEKLVPDK